MWRVFLTGFLGFFLGVGLLLQITTKEEISKKMRELLNMEDENGLIQTAKKCLPAVVLIHTFNDNAGKDGLIYNSAASPRNEPGLYNHGVGSGTIVTPDGYIITTYDCVKNAKRLIVSLNSEDRDPSNNDEMLISESDFEAKIVKDFPKLNISILKIDPKNGEFPFIELGNDNYLQKPDSVIRNASFTIGKAMGEHPITPNIQANSKNNFSVISHPIESVSMESHNGANFLILKNKIMGSCVFPENAGGPIISELGKLVGVIDFQATQAAMGFLEMAIPISTIKKAISIAVPVILAKNYDEELGITFENPKKDSNFGTIISSIYKDTAIGVVIKEVQEGLLADKGGIKPGDLLLECNGKIIKNEKIMKNIEKTLLGQNVIEFRILRGKNIISIEILR